MGQTKIEWTNKVWNPVTGCSPISEGCQNCYARHMAYRLKGRYGYPKDDPFRVTFHPDRLDEPLHWKKPSRIFVSSMGDLFHHAVHRDNILRVWHIMAINPKHTFIILTKRPERMWDLLTHWMQPALDISLIDHARPLQNLWLGVSVENQRTADERIPILLQIPAAKRFVSVEPMLENISMQREYLSTRCGGKYPFPQLENKYRTKFINLLDWVICGGETGPKARPMNPDWVRSLLGQCKEANIPFFFKQMSGKQPIPRNLMIREFPK